MSALENDLSPDTWIGLSFPLGRSESGFFSTNTDNIRTNVT